MSQLSLISDLQIWMRAPQLQPSSAATPHGDCWEARGMQEARRTRKQDWPQMAEVHMRRMSSVSPETPISPYITSVPQSCLTLWSVACQAFLSIVNSRSLLKLMSIVSVMASNHLTLCCPLLFPPLIFPSIRVFSNESFFCIRWPKYWSFSFRIFRTNS